MHPSLGGTEEILLLLDGHHIPLGWCLLENTEVLSRALDWQIDNIFQASERVPFLSQRCVYHRTYAQEPRLPMQNTTSENGMSEVTLWS